MIPTVCGWLQYQSQDQEYHGRTVRDYNDLVSVLSLMIRYPSAAIQRDGHCGLLTQQSSTLAKFLIWVPTRPLTMSAVIYRLLVLDF